MESVGETEVVTGVFLMASGQTAVAALRELEATPAGLMRTIIDLDKARYLGVANPAKALVSMEGGKPRFFGFDEIQRWLDPADTEILVQAIHRSREMKEGESTHFDVVYRPPHAAPFKACVDVRPMALDPRGMAYVVVSDVKLLPFDG